MEEEKIRMTEWICAHKRALLITAAAIALVIAAVCVLPRFLEYDSYETVSSAAHSRESNDQYIRFGGNIVQYGGDGITCLNADGSSLWSKSYEMEQPLIAGSDDYLAVADQGGSVIYLFDGSGYLSSVETPYPVRQLSISRSGMVAAVLEESDACRIMLYDQDGTIILEGQAHLDDNGYPAAIALSSDGTVMAVSYLTVSTGELSSTLSFYDLSNSENGTAQAVTSDTYEGESIVRLAEVGGTFAAFSDAAVRIYRSSADPTLLEEILTDGEVLSIVIGEDRFGIVSEADAQEAEEYTQRNAGSDSTDASSDASLSASSETVYAIDVYGKKGTRISHTLFSGDYQSITFLQDGTVAVLGTDTCRILTGLGRERFSYTFDETICAVFSNGLRGYTLVFTDRIETVRLK